MPFRFSGRKEEIDDHIVQQQSTLHSSCRVIMEYKVDDDDLYRTLNLEINFSKKMEEFIRGVAPTLKKLKNLDASDLVEQNFANNEIRVLRKYWENGDDFRESCRFLTLKSIAAFEAANISTLSEIDETSLGIVLRSCDPADENKIRGLYAKSSQSHLDYVKSREVERKIAEETADTIRKETYELRQKLREGGERIHGDVNAQIVKLAARAGIPNFRETQTVADPCKGIDQLISELDKQSRDLPKGDWTTDVELIASISAGKALCGLYIHPDPHKPPVNVNCPILSKPVSCVLMGPSLATEQKIYKFSSVSHMELFQSTVNIAGTSYGSNVAVSGYGASVFGDFNRAHHDERTEEEVEDSESTQACALVFANLPKASFRLTRDEMKLSTAATNKLLDVTSQSSALQFLKLFGSHMPTSVIHVGGMYSFACTVTATSKESSSKLQNLAAEQVSSYAKGGGGLFGVTVMASVKYDSESQVANRRSGSSIQKTAQTETSTSVHGPLAESPTALNLILNASNKTWRIIDRGTPQDYVPVWDLLRSECYLNKFASQAKLLQSVYEMEAVNTVGNLLNSPRLQYSTDQLRDHKAVILSARTELALNELKISETDCFSTETKAITAFAALTRMILLIEQLTGLNPEVIVFKRSEVQDFLTAIAQQQFREVHELIRRLIPYSKLSKLEAQGVIFGATVRKVIQTKIEPHKEQTISSSLQLSQLSEELKRLSSCYESEPDKLHSLVCQAISIVSLKPINQDSYELEQLNLLRKYVNEEGIALTSFESAHNVLFLSEQLASVCSIPNSNNTEFQPSEHCFDEQLLIDVVDINPTGLKLSELIADCQHPTTSQRELIQRIINRLDLHTPFVTEQSIPPPPPPPPLRTNVTDPNHPPKPGRFKPRSKSSSDKVFPNVPCLLSALYNSATLPVRMILSQQLLSQRRTCPLITFDPVRRKYLNHVQALRYADVSIGNDDHVNIMNDDSLLHVAVVTDVPVAKRQSCALAEKLFNISLLSTDKKTNVVMEGTFVEIGLGFLKSDDVKIVPVVVLAIFGDCSPFIPLLSSWVDFVCIEDDGEKTNLSSPNLNLLVNTSAQSQYCLIPWRGRSDRTDLEEIELENENNLLEGKISDLSETIKSDYFISFLVEQRKLRKKSSLNADPVGVFDQVKLGEIDTLIANLNMPEVRSSLQLQTLFKDECYLKRQASIALILLDQDRYNAHADQKAAARHRLADGSARLPLIDLFLRIIAIPKERSVLRIVALFELEHLLGAANLKQLSVYYERKSIQLKEWQSAQCNENKSSNSLAQRLYQNAQNDIINRSVSMEYLWREVVHIYCADVVRRDWLPAAAAQIILDGFPHELMDGEACGISSSWISAVFREIERELFRLHDKSIKVMTLSVLGEQSCGKSTFMNVAFGTRLRTSVGQCTRGVNFQLVQRTETGASSFDYLLLLDTEGIRSPEFDGVENRDAHDNKIAAMAVLPADACLLVINGERTEPMSEVMPMVGLAFYTSSIGAATSGRANASLFGIFTRLNFSEQKKCQEIANKFQSDVYDSVRKALEFTLQTNPSCEITNNSAAFSTIFGGFRGSGRDDDAESDIKFLGMLNRGYIPPDDTPAYEFGQRVRAAVLHAEKSITQQRNWSGRGLIEWCKYLILVWDCAQSNNLLGSLRTIKEAKDRADLAALAEEEERKVTIAYKKEYDEELILIRQENNSSANEMGDTNKLIEEHIFTNKLIEEHIFNLSSRVKPVTDASQKNLFELLDRPEYEKWKDSRSDAWRSFLVRTSEYWKTQLRSEISMLYLFETVANTMLRNFQRDIGKQLKDSATAERIREKLKKDEPCQEFLDLFNIYIRDAENQAQSKRIADNIPRLVLERYDQLTGNVYGLQKDVGDLVRPVNLKVESDKGMCAHCGASEAKILCARCKNIYYCSSNCQKLHRKEGRHKSDCIPQLASIANDNWSTGFADWWHRIAQFFYFTNSSQEIARNTAENLKQIVEQILGPDKSCSNRQLSYNPDLVVLVKEVVEKFILDQKIVNVDKKKELHRAVCAVLIKRMHQRQSAWEEVNNIAARIHAAKMPMWKFYVDIVNGLDASARLVKQIIRELSDRAVEDAFNSVCNGVCSSLLGATNIAWMQSRKALMAHVDFDLLDVAEKDTEAFMKLLRDPAGHFKSVFSRLIENEMQIDGKLQIFLNSVKTDFEEVAALFRASATDDNGIGMFDATRTNTPVQSTSSSLVKSPPIQEVLNNLKKKSRPCISESAATISPEVYAQLSDREIITALDDIITIISAAPPMSTATVEMSAELRSDSVGGEKKETSAAPSAAPSKAWEEFHNSFSKKKCEIPASVIEYFGDPTYSKNSSRPPCGEVCPLCGMYCGRPAGHSVTGGTPEEKLHDCCHQPDGLHGMRYALSNKISHTSCTQSVIKNTSFRSKETREEWKRYEDFSKVYPTWTTPSKETSTDTMVREFLFYQYNKEVWFLISSNVESFWHMYYYSYFY
jgi:hypothetical protein